MNTPRPLPQHPDRMGDEQLSSWVQRLIDDQVEEGLILDYKGQPYDLSGRDDKRSLAKDVTTGDVAMGPAIDFYGWTQIAEAGEDVLGFVLPEKLTVISRAVQDLERARQEQLSQGSTAALGLINEFIGGFGMGEVVYGDSSGFSVGGIPIAAESHGRSAQLFEAALRFAAARSSGLNFMVLDHIAPITAEFSGLMAKKLESSGIQVIQTFTTHVDGPASNGAYNGIAMRDGKAEVVSG